MSEPKRYAIRGFSAALVEEENGVYVRWDDYARLKESLRLQIEQNALAQVGFKMYQDNVDSGGLNKDRKDAIARLEADNARLKAEVERLTKAGDLMCRMAGNNQVINRHWKTAKKGVQS